MKISEAKAEEILKNDIVQFENAVNLLVKTPLNQAQFDALVSFVYNVGEDKFRRSTLLKRINANRLNDVPAEFMRWTRGDGKELPGLVRRRRAEVKLWRQLNTDFPVSTVEARTTPDEPPAKKSILQSREANGAVIAGASGAAAAAQEIIPAIKDGSDLISSLSTTAIICIVIVIAAMAIWYFRKQRLEEE
jgi:hypothetical protein